MRDILVNMNNALKETNLIPARSVVSMMAKTSLRSGEYERLGTVDHRQDRLGTNRVGFYGRCVNRRNLTGAILMLSLISLTTALWFVFELPVLMQELSNSLLVLIGGLLLVLYTYGQSRPAAQTRTLLFSSSVFLSIDVY